MRGFTKAKMAGVNDSGLVSLTPAQQNAEKVVQNAHTKLSTHQEDEEDEYRPNNKSQDARIQYQLKNVIGKGSFGVVYKAVNKKTSQVVAIKEIDYDNDEELNDIMSEIHLLKNLNHVNIVKYHGFIQKMDTLYIILEYCSRGSLKKLLTPSRVIPELEAKSYIRQTLQGLVYLHEQGVIHRDIKAANLLLDSNNVVKLADFGVSTKVNNASMAMTLAGSLNWMAPEIIGNRGASTLSDIWSLGATVVELLTGNPPFHNLVDVNIYYAIENDTYFPPANSISPQAIGFLSNCFQKNMYLRPTARKLLSHEWLHQDCELPDHDIILKNQVIGKLDRFKEDFENDDYTWDKDFKEKSVDLSPSKRNQYTPLNPTPSSTANSNGDSVNIFNNRLVSGNNEDYLLNKLKQGQLISNVAILFKDCEVESIIDAMFSIISTFDSVQTNKLLISLFEYDHNYNNSNLKEQFIVMGGLSYILVREELIISCFIEISILSLSPSRIYGLLIQCGIMNGNYFKTIKTQSLILELVLKYLEASSIKFWCKWCFQNLLIENILLNDKIHDRVAQVLILKLSSHASWFPEKFLPSLIGSYNSSEILSNSHTFHIVFKSISFMLAKSISDSNSHLSSPNVSPYSSMSSGSSYSNSLNLKSLSLNSGVRSSTFLSKLSAEFGKWLISFVETKSLTVDLKSWKYYIKVCYRIINLQKGSLSKFLYCDEFVNLVTKLLREHDNVVVEPILQQSLSICVELSMDIKSDRVSPLFFNLALDFTKLEKYMANGMQITLNCLQVLLHDNLKVTQISPDILSIDFAYKDNKCNIILHSSDLVEPFFRFKQESYAFGNFINNFSKICSIHQLDFICYNIVLNDGFYERITNFFHIYRSSLLLQIDILKYIKIVVTRALQYNADEDILIKLEDIVQFLNQNWVVQRHGEVGPLANQFTEQVGHDSILIHQLSKDIESLSEGNIPTNNNATNFDQAGFAVPRWTAN